MEESQSKNVTKSGKSPKGGWGQQKYQKAQNSKFGLFDKRGGRESGFLGVFPNVDFKCFR